LSEILRILRDPRSLDAFGTALAAQELDAALNEILETLPYLYDNLNQAVFWVDREFLLFEDQKCEVIDQHLVVINQLIESSEEAVRELEADDVDITYPRVVNFLQPICEVAAEELEQAIQLLSEIESAEEEANHQVDGLVEDDEDSDDSGSSDSTIRAISWYVDSPYLEESGMFPCA
jgi:hypothetical protein